MEKGQVERSFACANHVLSLSGAPGVEKLQIIWLELQAQLADCFLIEVHFFSGVCSSWQACQESTGKCSWC